MNETDTLLGRHQPMKGQLEFGFRVECSICWLEHGAHMYWCQYSKATERQKNMS